jgi:nickel transport protein
MTSRFLSLACGVAALVLCAAAAAPAQSVQAPPVPKTEAAAASPLPAGIDKALEKALDRKLAPIMRTLAEMQEHKVRLTDVLGGLGYIFGLVGVAAYFKRPRKG